MKSRVLFIGNSHLGCVKLAIDRQRSLLSEHEIDFMAVTQNWASDLAIVDGRLKPTAERGRELASRVVGVVSEAIVADYNAVVIVGMGVTMNWMGSLYLSHRLFMHRHPQRKLLSRPAFDAMVEDFFFQSGARQVADKLREVSDVPVLLIPEPPLNEEVRTVEEWKDVWSDELTSFLATTFRQGLQTTFLPKHVRILEAPSETLVEPYFTKAVYGRGAVNLFKSREGNGGGSLKRFKRDYRHMNEDYGSLLCIGIAHWLASLPHRGASAA